MGAQMPTTHSFAIGVLGQVSFLVYGFKHSFSFSYALVVLPFLRSSINDIAVYQWQKLSCDLLVSRECENGR